MGAKADNGGTPTGHPTHGFLTITSGFEPAWRPNNYRKNPKNSVTQKICCKHPKISKRRLYCRVMRPKDSDGIANSVDPDQTLGLHCLPRPICPET